MDAYQELKRFCGVCEEIAAERGFPICVTVVDAHGNVVLLHRMPGAPVLSLEMAERKAYTSVVLGCETAALADQILPGRPLYTLTSSSSRLIAFGGGTAVTFASESFGVGISGGPTAQEDIEMLSAAQARFRRGRWAPSATRGASDATGPATSTHQYSPGTTPN
jgi:uncharacterized protein GlcG (DUF336 family)